jgi:large subunit ribosomal protein L10
MALNLEQKKEVVAELAKVAASATSLVAAANMGMTVGQVTALRKKARESGVYLRVVKNTLLERAVEGTDFECVKGACKGPLVYAFSTDDPGAAGRLIKEATKGNDKLVTKVVSVGGKLYGPGDIDRLATLPTREQALSMLLGVLSQPAVQLVRTLAEPAAMLARTFGAVRDQKQAQSEAA